MISPLGERWSLDWWVGAEDRWHAASIETAVRQSLGDDGYTVETRLKVPGGDVVHRAVCVPSNGTSVALFEVENATPIPVALALVINFGHACDIAVDNDTVLVNGHPLLRAGRSVARVLVADSVDDALAAVDSGDAVPPPEMVFPLRGTVVVAIFPLPHTAVLKSTMALDVGLALQAPSDLPPIEAVARGWTKHIEGGSTVLLPDPRVTRAVSAARRHLLIGSGLGPSSEFWSQACEPWVPAVAAAALGAWGHVSEGRELLLSATGPDDLEVHAARSVAESGALLWAWAEHLERHRDPELQAAIYPWIEATTAALVPRRRGRGQAGSDESAAAAWRVVGLAAGASIMSRMGNHRTGADIVDALPGLLSQIDLTSAPIALALGGDRLAMGERPSLLASDSFASVVELADQVGAFAQQGRTQHPERSSLWLHAVRRAIVAEPAGTGGPVDLVGNPDQAWLGASIEAHDVPVANGVISFGVRWHGDRPALLWHLDGGAQDQSVTASGLDANWSDDRPEGEALLAVTPGLAVEDGPESARVRQGERIEIEDDPQSFG